jgi:hypothetical protein
MDFISYIWCIDGSYSSVLRSHIFVTKYKAIGSYINKYEAKLRPCTKTVSKRFCFRKSLYLFVYNTKMYTRHIGSCKLTYLSEYNYLQQRMQPNSLSWDQFFDFFLTQHHGLWNDLICQTQIKWTMKLNYQWLSFEYSWWCDLILFIIQKLRIEINVPPPNLFLLPNANEFIHSLFYS